MEQEGGGEKLSKEGLRLRKTRNGGYVKKNQPVD
jgi:hypothetical protein